MTNAAAASPTSLVWRERMCVSAHCRSRGAVTIVEWLPWGIPREAKRVPCSGPHFTCLERNRRRALNFVHEPRLVNRATEAGTCNACLRPDGCKKQVGILDERVSNSFVAAQQAVPRAKSAGHLALSEWRKAACRADPTR